MDKVRLTERESLILSRAQLQANASAKDLARESKVAEHVVRYTLHKYQSSGFIRRRAMLNPSRLGYVPYFFFFSVSYQNSSAETRLVKFIAESSLTASVFEAGGDFQFGALLYAEDVLEVSEFVGALAALPGVTLVEKSLGVRLGTTLFRRKYLSSLPSRTEEIVIDRSKTRASLDNLDRRILAALAHQNYDSRRELARVLNLPHTTLDSRVRRLEQEGVIAGYIFGMDVQRLDRSVSRVLLSTRGSPADIWTRLLELSRRESAVVQLARALGSWDYELLIETEGGRELVDIIRRLHAQLPSELTSVRTIPVYRYLKVDEYPRQ